MRGRLLGRGKWRVGRKHHLSELDLRIEEVEPGLEILPIEGRVAPPNEFNVLLRHRLLREADGLEGFGLVLEGAPPDQLSVTPFGDQPHRALDRCAAPRALAADASLRKRPVSEVSYLLHFAPQIRED